MHIVLHTTLESSIFNSGACCSKYGREGLYSTFSHPQMQSILLSKLSVKTLKVYGDVGIAEQPNAGKKGRDHSINTTLLHIFFNYTMYYVCT